MCHNLGMSSEPEKISSDPFIYADAPEINYSPELGRKIATEYSRGVSIKELHDICPDIVPSPYVLHRWRAVYPPFDRMMLDAESAMAHDAVSELVAVADDGSRSAADNSNRIRARALYAEKMDSARFGSRTVVDHSMTTNITIESAARLPDEVLAEIAMGGAKNLEELIKRIESGDVVVNTGRLIEHAPQEVPGLGDSDEGGVADEGGVLDVEK